MLLVHLNLFHVFFETEDIKVLDGFFVVCISIKYSIGECRLLVCMTVKEYTC